MAVHIDILHRVTDDELLALSDRNPGYQIERATDGRLVVSPTRSESGRQSGEVFLQLGIWNREARAGVVFDASTGFALPDGSCRSPDASWVRRDRWHALTLQERSGFAPLCPDAVFEVRSESDAVDEVHRKMEAYLDNGARIGVLVDPVSRGAAVYRTQGPVEHHKGGVKIALDPELPGFVLDLGPVFGDLSQ